MSKFRVQIILEEVTEDADNITLFKMLEICRIVEDIKESLIILGDCLENFTKRRLME